MGTSPYIKTLFTINELAWNLYNSNSRNVPKKNMNPIEIGKLLKNLKQGNVEFILIGGFAMAFHGFPRATGDIDLWIKNTPENMLRLREALISTGFPEAKALRSTTQLVPGMSIFNLLESDFKIDLLHNLKLFKEIIVFLLDSSPLGDQKALIPSKLKKIKLAEDKISFSESWRSQT